MVPDLSRSCWRKMVCKRHRRGGEGQVLPQTSSPHPIGAAPLTSQLRILFQRIWNSTSPRRALPSFWEHRVKEKLGSRGVEEQSRHREGEASRSWPL